MDQQPYSVVQAIYVLLNLQARFPDISNTQTFKNGISRCQLALGTEAEVRSVEERWFFFYTGV